MNKKTLVGLCMAACCACHPTATLVRLENPLALERPDEAFVITHGQLQDPGNGAVPLVCDEGGVPVPSQLDDLDGDGRWDELAFVYTLSPHQKVDLRIAWIDRAGYPVFKERTSVRYGKMTSPAKIEPLTSDVHGKYNLPRGKGYPYQMDGVAWENDKMGFRHYYDGRNSRDVFGKRVPDMVLDTVGIGADGCPGDTYHVLSDWGRDIMSAGGSFGLGALAMLSQGKLIRSGILQEDRTDIIDSTYYDLLAEGPVRSVFRMRFRGWEVRDHQVDVTETTTIRAGKYGYENVIEVGALPAGDTLVTGIVRSFNDRAPVEKKIGDRIVMMTHDRQSYDKEWYMGMALIIPQENCIETFDTPDAGTGADIIRTWCVKLKPGADGKIRFGVYAAWELQDTRFTQADFFFRLIEEEAERLADPVKMTLLP
ncbi:MAG: DUF4861 domain-containing protein [Tannerella sp.]|nr:DUF4861 domain-containing protein [Tannerella sp.]